jgi:hypothetical protein
LSPPLPRRSPTTVTRSLKYTPFFFLCTVNPRFQRVGNAAEIWIYSFSQKQSPDISAPYTRSNFPTTMAHLRPWRRRSSMVAGRESSVLRCI